MLGGSLVHEDVHTFVSRVPATHLLVWTKLKRKESKSRLKKIWPEKPYKLKLITEVVPDASKTFPSSCLPDHLAKHPNPMEEIGGCFALVQWSVT